MLVVFPVVSLPVSGRTQFHPNFDRFAAFQPFDSSLRNQPGVLFSDKFQSVSPEYRHRTLRAVGVYSDRILPACPDDRHPCPIVKESNVLKGEGVHRQW